MTRQSLAWTCVFQVAHQKEWLRVVVVVVVVHYIVGIVAITVPIAIGMVVTAIGSSIAVQVVGVGRIVLRTLPHLTRRRYR